MTRHTAVLAVAALLIPGWGNAGVDVRSTGETVDVLATNVPLSEVLDRLSRQIQMKVVYDGAPPRQNVSIDLRGRSPIDAVVATLEGQGVNYAMAMDETGTRVQTLLVSGVVPATGRSGAPEQGARSSMREAPVPEAMMEEPEPVPETAEEAAPPPDTSAGLALANPQQQSERKEEQPPAPQPEQSGAWSSSPFAPSGTRQAPAATPAPAPQATPPPFNP